VSFSSSLVRYAFSVVACWLFEFLVCVSGLVFFFFPCTPECTFSRLSFPPLPGRSVCLLKPAVSMSTFLRPHCWNMRVKSFFSHTIQTARSPSLFKSVSRTKGCGKFSLSPPLELDGHLRAGAGVSLPFCALTDASLLPMHFAR